MYTVTVADANGCTGSSPPHTVTLSPRPAAVIAGPLSVCVNARVLYRTAKQSGVSYSWTVIGGSITSTIDADSIVVQWSSSGSGTVIVRLANGSCVAADTLDVNIGTSLRPRVTADGPLSRCAGDSIALLADAGYTTSLGLKRTGQSKKRHEATRKSMAG